MYTRQKGKYLIKFRVCSSLRWRICRWGMTIRKFYAFHHIGKCFESTTTTWYLEKPPRYVYVSAWLFIIHTDIREPREIHLQIHFILWSHFSTNKKMGIHMKVLLRLILPLCVDNLWNLNGGTKYRFTPHNPVCMFEWNCYTLWRRVLPYKLFVISYFNFLCSLCYNMRVLLLF